MATVTRPLLMKGGLVAQGVHLDIEMRIVWEKAVCCWDGMHGKLRRQRAAERLKQAGARKTERRLIEEVGRMLDEEFDRWAAGKKRRGFYNF